MVEALLIINTIVAAASLIFGILRWVQGKRLLNERNC